jgi:hypothetical protein
MFLLDALRVAIVVLTARLPSRPRLGFRDVVADAGIERLAAHLKAAYGRFG